MRSNSGLRKWHFLRWHKLAPVLVIKFEVSKNASYQKEHFCIRQLLDWSSNSGVVTSDLSLKFTTFTLITLVFIHQSGRCQKMFLIKRNIFVIKQLFDWRSNNSLRIWLLIPELQWATLKQRLPSEVAIWPLIENLSYSKNNPFEKWHFLNSQTSKFIHNWQS